MVCLILIKPFVGHKDIVTPGFTLYKEGDNSVLLEPLGERVHKGQSLLGRTVTQQIAAFTIIIIIQADFMQIDQGHQPA